MTNIGIKSTQLSNIRAALLENAQNSKLEPKQLKILATKLRMHLITLQMLKIHLKLAQNYELGKEHDLTKVMVSQNISSLAFQMTLNAENKMLNAYKDIMNMPV